MVIVIRHVSGRTPDGGYLSLGISRKSAPVAGRLNGTSGTGVRVHTAAMCAGNEPGLTGPETAADDVTVADLKLFRAIGLHQMLNPADRRSGYRLRLAYRAVVALAFALQSVQIVGLFFTLNDLRRFAYMTVMVFNGLMCVLKGHVLVMNADRLWAVLDVARYRYTVCGARDPTALHRCRATLAVLLRTFAVLSFSTLIIWSTMPLFMDPYVPITKPDGTVGQYRTTIDNLWFPAMTESVYNYTPVWAFIYSMEVFICTFNVISWLLFDSCMVTISFVLHAQFRTMAAGYESLGRHRDRRRIRLRRPSTDTGRTYPYTAGASGFTCSDVFGWPSNESFSRGNNII